MKLIFESETELGSCDSDRVNGHFGDDTGGWAAFAYTSATQTGSKGMLRIEQRCYLRSSERLDDIRAQNWVRSEMMFEPSLGSKEETVAMVQELHDQYVAEARETFADQAVLISTDAPGLAERS